MSEQERMECDVLIVGAGPSGLSAAIRLKQLAAESNQEISVYVLEKGAEVGAHILSGAVLEPRALDELLPDWKNLSAPLEVPVTQDRLMLLTKSNAFRLPTPPQMNNHGNYIVSLGNVCRFLAEQATQLGVEIYPGFAASEAIIEQDRVVGVKTGDMGIAKDGARKETYQAGIELRATYTLLAEGCRGSISETLMKRFGLRNNTQTQTYGIGIKELWEVPEAEHQEGLVLHTIGWPLDRKTYGGSFMYHLNHKQIAVGFVIGLDYENPYLTPFKEFQRFKTHPKIRDYFEGGKRIAYGARAINEGGYQSIPELAFPGGALIGCAAGFVNVPKIKGTHTAMKTGMLAAEAVMNSLKEKNTTLTSYTQSVTHSWVGEELQKVRNLRPAFAKWGLWGGLAYAACDTYLFFGHTPWTLSHHSADHESFKKASECKKIAYEKPDGVLTFDLLSSVFISNTNHEEDQPTHLTLKDANVPVMVNAVMYDGPEGRYCPAGVYEFTGEGEELKLQINAQNCVHCKTCDIKDPTQNIVWTTPEGGGGPRYPNM